VIVSSIVSRAVSLLCVVKWQQICRSLTNCRVFLNSLHTSPDVEDVGRSTGKRHEWSYKAQDDQELKAECLGMTWSESVENRHCCFQNDHTHHMLEVVWKCNFTDSSRSLTKWFCDRSLWSLSTKRSLYDFAQHSATGRHKLWKQCWKDHWLCTPPTRHVHLRSHKFDQQNHTTASLVRSRNNNPVITSQKHWYESSGLGCHPNMMSFHTRTSRHMNFRAYTRNTRQSTDRITWSGFSNCPWNCIFTPSPACNGRGRSGNSNVCSLRPHSMSSQDILPSTPGLPALYTTTRVFSPYSSRRLPHREMCARNSKKLGSSWVICRFAVILQHTTVRPPSKQLMKQSRFWFVYLFCSHS
jgi:hypothetical protein